jgi:hypothetical protein
MKWRVEFPGSVGVKRSLSLRSFRSFTHEELRKRTRFVTLSNLPDFPSQTQSLSASRRKAGSRFARATNTRISTISLAAISAPVATGQPQSPPNQPRNPTKTALEIDAPTSRDKVSAVTDRRYSGKRHERKESERFNPDRSGANRFQRVENERFRSFTYEELTKRHKHFDPLERARLAQTCSRVRCLRRKAQGVPPALTSASSSIGILAPAVQSLPRNPPSQRRNQSKTALELDRLKRSSLRRMRQDRKAKSRRSQTAATVGAATSAKRANA